MEDNKGKTIKKKAMYVVFLVSIVMVLICFFLRGKIFGKKDYIEGKDIEILTNRFTSFSNIIRCYYTIDIVSAGGIGPTRYNMKAIAIIDEQESRYLKEQYNWEIAQIVVEENLYKEVESEIVREWLYSKEFCSDTLGGSYIGEVYFSEKDNCIYIIASM